MTISGLRSYRLACGTSKQKILIEMNSPKMEVMDSSIDMKMGEVQIKWRIVGDSKLNYTLGRILPINRFVPFCQFQDKQNDLSVLGLERALIKGPYIIVFLCYKYNSS